MYVYYRHSDDENGKAGTPYYVGISSGPEHRRRFAPHRPDVPVPTSESGLNVIVQRFETEELLKEAEKNFIAKWGRIGLESSGVLMNCSPGGEFKNDSQWSSNVKTKEAEWIRRYNELVESCSAFGLSLLPWNRRVIDAAYYRQWGKGSKRSMYKHTRQVFSLWTALSVNDNSDELYYSAVLRLLELKVLGGSLRNWLLPGQCILWLDEYWTPAQCSSFLRSSSAALLRSDV